MLGGAGQVTASTDIPIHRARGVDLAQAMLPLSESNGRHEMSTGRIGHGGAARARAKVWGVILAGGAGVAAWEPSERQ